MIQKQLLLLLLVFSLPWLLFNCEKANIITVTSTEVSGAPLVGYDIAFKRWGEFYFPFEDWHWWKSQGIAESNLDPDAVSWCGAGGIMQLMPATAAGLLVKNRFDPEESIQGGIHYDRQMDTFFKQVIQPERKRFMFAGYNAGPGNIQKAKKLANSNIWDQVAISLPKVTGQHSKETIGYIKRIYKIKENL